MAGAIALPCRHPGAPPDEVIDLVAEAIKAIASDEAFLSRRGLTTSDFNLALPAAIQRMRGSAAAGNADRRQFLVAIFNHMVTTNVITGFDIPVYGDDTVYRLNVPSIGSVAIIQKGCPDGAHSSVAWSAPEWADEVYLWWLCDSLQGEPGEHVAKGANRLRGRFFSAEYTDALDGVIFHNATCGTPLRPCPKLPHGAVIDGRTVPPPCIWVMPERATSAGSAPASWNWDSTRTRLFPAVLLSAFGIKSSETPSFTGGIGFRRGVRGIYTSIRSRYGAGSSAIYRSDAR